MLRKLSLRNAKRQFSEYVLFFVTLACAVAFMYAFNALLFSDIVKALPEMEILPYLIVTASALIILIMGWMISYMIHYMLKRRSREFGIYLMSGIPNRKLATLLFYENSMIGLMAFGLGLVFGMLFSQILEAVLLNLFGLPYMLHFGFSVSAVGLTFLYFAAMMLYSIRKSRKWIRRVQLKELLYYDRVNEKALVSGNGSAVLLFFLSVLAGCGGCLLLALQPIEDGYDVLIGTVLLLLFLFGFFKSVPAFLSAQFENRTAWKYRKHRLVPLRGFIAKVNSTSTVMGVLSILFMLVLTFLGIGSMIGLMITEKVEAGVFDVMILHSGEMGDFSRYDSFLRQKYAAKGYRYGIYTNGKTDFLAVREQTVIEAGRKPSLLFAEFQWDTCMAQSDYLTLRDLLGYEHLELDPALSYVHCVPTMAEGVRALMEGQGGLTCGGYAFAADGVFTEAFSQVDEYGNGFGYILVVPDSAVEDMKLVYSVYAAVTEKPLNAADLQQLTSLIENTVSLDRGIAKSNFDGAPTLFYGDWDFLSGKWMDKAGYGYLYAMLICLIYLALVLEMTGAAVLATQVLGDWQEKQRQERILRQLGMDARMIFGLRNRQLAQIFLFPLIPALVISISFILICAQKMLTGFFELPPVADIVLVGQSFAVSFLMFSLLYGIYYAAARISSPASPCAQTSSQTSRSRSCSTR